MAASKQGPEAPPPGAALSPESRKGSSRGLLQSTSAPRLPRPPSEKRGGGSAAAPTRPPPPPPPSAGQGGSPPASALTPEEAGDAGGAGVREVPSDSALVFLTCDHHPDLWQRSAYEMESAAQVVAAASQDLLKSLGGRELYAETVTLPGEDEILGGFGRVVLLKSVVDAVNYCAELRRRLPQLEYPKGLPEQADFAAGPKLRFAVHSAEGLLTRDDPGDQPHVFGTPLQQVAALCSCARGGDILATEAALRKAAPVLLAQLAAAYPGLGDMPPRADGDVMPALAEPLLFVCRGEVKLEMTLGKTAKRQVPALGQRGTPQLLSPLQVVWNMERAAAPRSTPPGPLVVGAADEAGHAAFCLAVLDADSRHTAQLTPEEHKAARDAQLARQSQFSRLQLEDQLRHTKALAWKLHRRLDTQMRLSAGLGAALSATERAMRRGAERSVALIQALVVRSRQLLRGALAERVNLGAAAQRAAALCGSMLDPGGGEGVAEGAAAAVAELNSIALSVSEPPPTPRQRAAAELAAARVREHAVSPRKQAGAELLLSRLAAVAAAGSASIQSVALCAAAGAVAAGPLAAGRDAAAAAAAADILHGEPSGVDGLLSTLFGFEETRLVAPGVVDTTERAPPPAAAQRILDVIAESLAEDVQLPEALARLLPGVAVAPASEMRDPDCPLVHSAVQTMPIEFAAADAGAGRHGSGGSEGTMATDAPDHLQSAAWGATDTGQLPWASPLSPEEDRHYTLPLSSNQRRGRSMAGQGPSAFDPSGGAEGSPRPSQGSRRSRPPAVEVGALGRADEEYDAQTEGASEDGDGSDECTEPAEYYMLPAEAPYNPLEDVQLLRRLVLELPVHNAPVPLTQDTVRGLWEGGRAARFGGPAMPQWNRAERPPSWDMAQLAEQARQVAPPAGNARHWPFARPRRPLPSVRPRRPKHADRAGGDKIAQKMRLTCPGQLGSAGRTIPDPYEWRGATKPPPLSSTLPPPRAADRHGAADRNAPLPPPNWLSECVRTTQTVADLPPFRRPMYNRTAH